MSERPIVIFGGSFDPPTTAHATLPPRAAQAVDASALVYVPAAISPHKLDAPPTDAVHRLAMVRLIVDELPGATIDDRELHRDGPSYTVDTLEAFHDEFDAPMRLLIGTDQMAVFHRWHRWREVLELAAPLVMVRADDDVGSLLTDVERHQGEATAKRWRAWVTDLPRLPQASSAVRTRVATGDGIEGDVPESVARYIHAHGLYGSAGVSAR